MGPAAQERLISAGHVKPNPEWGLKAHSHPFHELIAVVRGRIRVVMRAQEFLAGPGELLLYPAGTAHEEVSDPRNPVETYFLAFEHPAFAAELPLKFRDSRGRVGLLISWLCAERPAVTAAQKAVVDLLFRAATAEALRAASEVEAWGLAARMRSWMRERLNEPISLDSLAEQAGLDRYRFLRAFKRSAGHTPMQELRLLRLEKAKFLLLTTDLPLKAIAPEVGIGDEYQLSKLFRKEFGMPPGELRRSLAATER
jgi:AraC-like DNA-binding protein